MVSSSKQRASPSMSASSTCEYVYQVWHTTEDYTSK